jgi:hypothetical protein
MKELPTLPNIMGQTSPAAIASNDGFREPERPAPPKIAAEPPNRIQSIRLAAALEKLHGVAHDPSSGEEDGVTAARALAMTMLQNFPTIIWALRKAGSPGKR